MNNELDSFLAQLHESLAQLYGPRLRQIILFGSRARGDAEPDSDVDLLIVLSGAVQNGTEIARTGPILADLSIRTGLVPSCLFISEDRFQSGEGPLLRNIRREGVPV